MKKKVYLCLLTSVLFSVANAQNIDFADKNVKAICVANWDTDGDGELSMAEAAAVTSLGEVFRDNDEITSFDELQYFTGITEIEGGCFDPCISLTSIIIPAGVTSLYGSSFSNCPSLEQISVDPANSVYDSRNDCNGIIETETNKLVVGCNNTHIPDGVTCIGNNAFGGRWWLQSMNIPETVTTIETWAFSHCLSLQTITIPSSVSVIGDEAFTNCGSLSRIFVNWESPIAIPENVFVECDLANAILYVPEGCKTAYKVTNYWKEFAHIRAIGGENMINIIHNSDLEGTAVCYFSSDGDIGFTISDGVGKDDSRGITIESIDNPENAWYTQLFVRLPQTVPVGTSYQISFDYKASQEVDNEVVFQREWGENTNDYFGIHYTTEWQHYESSGIVSENMHFITFHLSEPSTATTYYFDNIVFEIDEYGYNERSQWDNTIYLEDMKVISGTEAVLSVKMDNNVVAEGFEFEMNLPEGISVVQDEDGFPEVTLSTDRTDSQRTNTFDAVIQPDGTLKVFAASNNGSTIDGYYGEIVQVKVAIADDMANGDYTIYIRNITISDDNAVSHYLWETKSNIDVSAYLVGDANTDLKVDVADFVAVAHYLLERTPENFHMKAADANQDEVVDVADLTAIAHLRLYGTISKPTEESPAKRFVMGAEADTENYIYVDPISVDGESEITLSVKMKNAVEAEGFAFDLYLPEGMSFVTNNNGFVEASLSTERTTARKTNSFNAVIRQDGSLRVLAASTNGSSISGNDGEVALVTIHIDSSLTAGEYLLQLKNIAISDVDAVSHRTDIQESKIIIVDDGITTGIVNIQDSMSTVQSGEWYSLDGKKLGSQPKAKGVYIKNGKKVVIK